MHTRKQILINQKKFNKEIVNFLKKDFLNQQKELVEIETEDDLILKKIKILEKKFKKVDIEKESKKFFINEINLNPKFYAWWNEDEENVEIFLYEKK